MGGEGVVPRVLAVLTRRTDGMRARLSHGTVEPLVPRSPVHLKPSMIQGRQRGTGRRQGLSCPLHPSLGLWTFCLPGLSTPERGARGAQHSALRVLKSVHRPRQEGPGRMRAGGSPGQSVAAPPGRLLAVRTTSPFLLMLRASPFSPQRPVTEQRECAPLGTWQEAGVLSPAAVLVQENFDKIGLVHFIKCKY